MTLKGTRYASNLVILSLVMGILSLTFYALTYANITGSSYLMYQVQIAQRDIQLPRADQGQPILKNDNNMNHHRSEDDVLNMNHYKHEMENEFIKLNITISDLQFIHKLPKLIHFVWISNSINNDNEMDDQHTHNINTFYKIYSPDAWKIIVWTNRNARHVFCNKNDIDSSDIELCNLLANETLSDAYGMNVVMKADILRYMILYKFGGVYFDSDFVALRDLTDIIKQNIDKHGLIVCNEDYGAHAYLSNGFFIAYAKNKCVQMAKDNVAHSLTLRHRSRLPANRRTGPYFWKMALVAAFREYYENSSDAGSVLMSSKLKQRKATVSAFNISTIAVQLPTHYMYPVSYKAATAQKKIKKLLQGSRPDVYAIHIWGPEKSW
eukprot:158861_1